MLLHLYCLPFIDKKQTLFNYVCNTLLLVQVLDKCNAIFSTYALFLIHLISHTLKFVSSQAKIFSLACKKMNEYL